ncbi:hypothetical protein AB0D68_21110 [Streptomyces sp. NPDC048212]|uniref:hypothetical protein n=1 Tax=Streptomyces sp. NPDC048212 TaxID=3156658 RepID=UPI0034029D23
MPETFCWCDPTAWNPFVLPDGPPDRLALHGNDDRPVAAGLLELVEGFPTPRFLVLGDVKRADVGPEPGIVVQDAVDVEVERLAGATEVVLHVAGCRDLSCHIAACGDRLSLRQDPEVVSGGILRVECSRAGVGRSPLVQRGHDPCCLKVVAALPQQDAAGHRIEITPPLRHGGPPLRHVGGLAGLLQGGIRALHRASVEAVHGPVHDVGVDHGGCEGEPDAVVGVSDRLDRSVEESTPPGHLCANAFLVAGVMHVRTACTLAELFGIERNDALVGDAHAVLDRVGAHGAHPAAEGGELGV